MLTKQAWSIKDLLYEKKNPIFLWTQRVILKTPYYMVSLESGHGKSNPLLQSATQAGKMELSCLLGTTSCIPQDKFP